MDKVSPAGLTFEWDTVELIADPRRVRAHYRLDDYYAAKKMLQDYDIDAVMSSGLADSLTRKFPAEFLITCLIFLTIS